MLILINYIYYVVWSGVTCPPPKAANMTKTSSSDLSDKTKRVTIQMKASQISTLVNDSVCVIAEESSFSCVFQNFFRQRNQ